MGPDQWRLVVATHHQSRAGSITVCTTVVRGAGALNVQLALDTTYTVDDTRRTDQWLKVLYQGGRNG